MTRLQFDALVRRIEARYAGRPAALELATAAWVAAGRGFALGWIALLIAAGLGVALAGIVVEPPAGLVLLGLGVGLIVYAIAQAGLLMSAEPAGDDSIALDPARSPALSGMLDDLCRDLQCRPFGEVRLSMDFNAGVREEPRLGVFGWPRTTLELGLPLLAALTPDEFRAVLAHEFAHLSAHHGRRGHGIFRLHQTWDTLARKFQEPTSGRAVRWAVGKFLDWFWPRFRARVVVLSRLQEYQADRTAADLVDAGSMASALWRMELLNSWFPERFWVDINGQAVDRPDPPVDILARMRSALADAPAPDDAALWARRGLSRATGVDNTHPALRDRIGALGVSAEALAAAGARGPDAPTAAEALLGNGLELIEHDLSLDWSRRERASWRERHRKAAAEARRRTRPPTESPTPSPAGVAALWEAARAAVELNGLASAEPSLRAILDADPDHPGAAVLLGQSLAARGLDEGERLLLGVIDRGDEAWTPPAGEALAAHYRANGRADLLLDIRGRLDRHDADVTEARRERSTITPRDILLPHSLADDQLEPLRALLVAEPDGSTARLARKQLRHFPQRPLFLLAVRARPTRLGFANADLDRALARRLVPKVVLPGQVLVITRQGAHGKLARRLFKMPGTELDRRT